MTNWITNFSNNKIDQPNGAIQLITGSISKSAQAIGFQELNYTNFEFTDYYPERRQTLIKTILDQVRPGDLIVLQFPMYVSGGFTEDFIKHLFSLKDVKKVAIIVDIPTWQDSTSDADYNAESDWWLKWLRHFDLLIVANQKEADHLRRDEVNVPMISMGISDYLYHGPLKKKRYKKELYFVTSRDVQNVNYTASTPINFYSQNTTKAVTANPSVTWHGHRESDEIIASLDGGFGIVTSENFDAMYGEKMKYYTQYNNPTKLSLYLAAGLPVITMSKTPHASLIKEHNLGLIVDDLNTIDQVLTKIDIDDYQVMLKAVQPWQRAITSGFFTKRALMAAIGAVNLGFKDNLTSI